jgi:translation initiation factor 2D
MCVQAAGKGKLLEVLQHYGDTLWLTLGREAAPNEGFQDGFVAPLNLIAEAVAAAEAAGDGGPAAAEEAAEGVEQLALNSSSISDHPPAAAAPQGGCAEGGSSSSGVDMDQLLEASLLQALLKSVKDADLPLSSTTLWSQHIKPCRPVKTELDVKKSSHKKMSKFLQVGIRTLQSPPRSRSTAQTLSTATCLALFLSSPPPPPPPPR